MRGVIIAVSAALMLSACSDAAEIRGNTESRTQTPPKKFRGDNSNIIVHFSSNTDDECVKRGLPLGRETKAEACAILSRSKSELVLPNPCERKETYARIVCHELAHANGWSAYH